MLIATVRGIRAASQSLDPGLILQALPSSVVNTVGRYVPANIGATVTSTSGVAGFEGHHSFSPWAGLAILAVYAAVALVVGGWVMVRRDA